MTDFDKTLHAQLRHLIDDLTVAVDDDGHTRYAPKNTLMFSNFIGALIELMPTLAARAQPAQVVPGSTDEYEQWVKDGRPMPAQAVPVLTDADWPDVDDMAHSAVQEALAFGLNHDVFYRYGHAVLAKAQLAAEQAVRAKIHSYSQPTLPEELHIFLDAAAGEGFVIGGVDAADLYATIYPQRYAAVLKG